MVVRMVVGRVVGAAVVETVNRAAIGGLVGLVAK